MRQIKAALPLKRTGLKQFQQRFYISACYEAFGPLWRYEYSFNISILKEQNSISELFMSLCLFLCITHVFVTNSWENVVFHPVLTDHSFVFHALEWDRDQRCQLLGLF
jgi:hypothetical protein